MGIRSATTTLANKADSTRTRRAGIIGQASGAGEKIRESFSRTSTTGKAEKRKQNRRDGRAEKQGRELQLISGA